MSKLDPVIESAFGIGGRHARSLVFLDRAAWCLGESLSSLASDPSLEELNTTIEILRGAAAQAAADLAKAICERG